MKNKRIIYWILIIIISSLCIILTNCSNVKRENLYKIVYQNNDTVYIKGNDYYIRKLRNGNFGIFIEFDNYTKEHFVNGENVKLIICE